jgi:hypothetical protein
MWARRSVLATSGVLGKRLVVTFRSAVATEVFFVIETLDAGISARAQANVAIRMAKTTLIIRFVEKHRLGIKEAST